MKGLTWRQIVSHIEFDDLDDVIIENVDIKDYPEFCDAFIASATYKGIDIGDTDLDYLTDKFYEEVNALAHEHIQGYE